LGENYRLLSNLEKNNNNILFSQLNSSLIDELRYIPIFFFSSKFSIKHSTFFKILSIEVRIMEQKEFELEILLDIYNEKIFKKIILKAAKERKSQ
jgi:hypothetical protein